MRKSDCRFVFLRSDGFHSTSRVFCVHLAINNRQTRFMTVEDDWIPSSTIPKPAEFISCTLAIIFTVKINEQFRNLEMTPLRLFVDKMNHYSRLPAGDFVAKSQRFVKNDRQLPEPNEAKRLPKIPWKENRDLRLQPPSDSLVFY